MTATLGIGKVMTVSCTYDHRIIQGAESGMLLKQVHELLLGADDFYEAVFRAIGVPYEPVRWRQDPNPVDHDSAQVVKQMQVSQRINWNRVRGHLFPDAGGGETVAQVVGIVEGYACRFQSFIDAHNKLGAAQLGVSREVVHVLRVMHTDTTRARPLPLVSSLRPRASSQTSPTSANSTVTRPSKA